MVSPLDVQRLFLQSVISRRVISADLAKVLWAQCVQAVKGLVLCHAPRLSAEGARITAVDDTLQINANGPDGWSEFLNSLNKSLDPLDLELSRIRNEETGKEVYALVSPLSPTATIDSRIETLRDCGR
jgi:non-structural maintenance of chromosomes element 1